MSEIIAETKKVNDLYIYHHLGLGDHIICNGLIREYANSYSRVMVFVRTNNVVSVKFMYRDLKNVSLVVVDRDGEACAFLDANKEKRFLKVGHEHLNTKDVKFDECFYKQVGMDFNKRWDSFFVERDKAKELEIMKHFGVKEGQYVFLHEDKSRGFLINRSYIHDKSLLIVEPGKGLTENMFDYCGLIENAREVHCMDSSFKLLADSLPNAGKAALFHHVYVRGSSNIHLSSSRLQWKCIANRYPFVNKLAEYFKS